MDRQARPSHTADRADRAAGKRDRCSGEREIAARLHDAVLRDAGLRREQNIPARHHAAAAGDRIGRDRHRPSIQRPTMRERTRRTEREAIPRNELRGGAGRQCGSRQRQVIGGRESAGDVDSARDRDGSDPVCAGQRLAAQMQRLRIERQPAQGLNRAGHGDVAAAYAKHLVGSAIASKGDQSRCGKGKRPIRCHLRVRRRREIACSFQRQRISSLNRAAHDDSARLDADLLRRCQGTGKCRHTACGECNIAVGSHAARQKRVARNGNAESTARLDRAAAVQRSGVDSHAAATQHGTGDLKGRCTQAGEAIALQ